MLDLSNLNALVTGATGGIGRSIAQRLASQGARLAVTGTRANVLDEVATSIGNDTVACTADLGSSDGAKSLIEALSEQGFSPDIVILNAGITRDSLMLRMSDEDWDNVMSTNLRSAFVLARACLRSMMKRRFGRIIAITSVVGSSGNMGQANYVAAKAGLTGLIKSIALETASRGITANCVAPGYIDTPMTESLSDDVRNKIVAQIPSSRIGTPEDVASAVTYLSSREAAYVTGQTLHVNGGMSTAGG